nr:peptidyl-tRNA hydrolase 2, mitochondrial-like isoform X2 [Lepeophtheirus salmonis]
MWWKNQLMIMFVGILCGVFVNAFLRRSASSSLSQNSRHFLSNLFKSTKMVFLVRTDIGMGKGKIASQVAHAAILCYQDAQRKKSDHLNNWEYTGQMKVVLKCSDEAEFDRLYTEAKNLGLITSVVKDAGRTQIPHGTKTVVGIGPGPLEVIDKITGHLKLY